LLNGGTVCQQSQDELAITGLAKPNHAAQSVMNIEQIRLKRSVCGVSVFMNSQVRFVKRSQDTKANPMWNSQVCQVFEFSAADNPISLAESIPAPNVHE
jgi:hypothetical protein